MRKTNKLPEVLTTAEIQAILDQFNPRYAGPRRNQLMIQVALATGARIAEITALRFEDCTIDSGACRVHIHEGKGKKDRIVWMPAPLYANVTAMAAQEGREATGLMFCTRGGERIDHGYLRRTIKARGVAAGVPRIHWHLLRHTALTKLYSNTRDLLLVQQAAGHSSPSTTAIYSHISGEDLRAAMLDAAN